MRRCLFAMMTVALASPAFSQEAPSSPQPPSSSQPAASPQNSPTGRPGTVGDQPASPGTGPLEGAQPGQSGTAQELERRAIDNRPAPTQPFGPQPSDQQRQVDQFNTQQPLDQRSFDERTSTDRNTLDRTDRLGRTRTFQGAPRGWAREGERGFIINDLRARGLVADDWRLVLHGGRWWFWTPEEAWLVYGDDGDWIGYEPGMFERSRIVGRRPVVAFPPGYPRDDWRLVFHNGRWWFWAPNERWLYFDRGRWVALSERANALARERQLRRERVGYRGPERPPEQQPPPETQSPQPSAQPSGTTEGDMDL